jgi:hypothetical protein
MDPASRNHERIRRDHAARLLRPVTPKPMCGGRILPFRIG